MDKAEHARSIVEQFTQQANLFAAKHRSHIEALRLLVQTIGVRDDDVALDVACGPGLVTCAVARVAHVVIGVDLTPAMLRRAQQTQQKAGLTNVTWMEADASALPFPDASFSLVVTRYSFHHLLNPARVLSEMRRVCQPGGRVAVIDTTPDANKADAYNHFEKLRDPSHVRAMPPAELEALLQSAGLHLCARAFYGWETELERQLQSSFPDAASVVLLREMAQGDVGVNRLGFDTQERDGAIYITYPTSIFVSSKPN